MELTTVKVDTAKIEAGEWVKDIPGMGDLELRVRGLGSVVYREALARRQRTVKPSNDGVRPIAESEAATAHAVADALLLDWRNLTLNGQARGYTVELARDLLTNRDYVAFLDAVLYAAATLDASSAKVEETLAKNSDSGSAGAVKTATKTRRKS